MKNYLSINSLIPSFNKVLNVPGDKSLSIRWVLLASQAIGKSKAYNLLESEDVISAIVSMRKLGVEIIFVHQAPDQIYEPKFAYQKSFNKNNFWK